MIKTMEDQEGHDIEYVGTTVDVQDILKTCPVKMKSITAFFQSTTPKRGLTQDEILIKKNKTEQKTAIKESEINSKSHVLSLNRAGFNDLEIPYEKFVKENEKENVNSLNKDGNGSADNRKHNITSKANEISYEAFLEYCHKGDKSQCFEDVGKSESSAVVSQNQSIENMDCDDSKIPNLKTTAISNENMNEKNTVIDNNKTETVNSVSEIDTDNILETEKLENEECNKPVTGKGSILNFFKKCSKTENSKDNETPDIVITKVLVHSEPLNDEDENNFTETDKSVKTFAIFNSNTRKSGLESLKGLKSNVSVSSADIDMSITVIESIVSDDSEEENIGDDNKSENQEGGDSINDKLGKKGDKNDKKKDNEDRKKNLESKMASLDRIHMTSKGKKAQATLSFGKKGVALGKPVKGKGKKIKETNELNSSQSDDFTPNSKKKKDKEKKRIRTLKFCGKCSACNITEDCGECLNCLDKPKFGGPGTKKQKCKARHCEMFSSPTRFNKLSHITEKKVNKVNKAKELVQKARARKSVKVPKSPLKVSPKRKTVVKKVPVKMSPKKVISVRKKTPLKLSPKQDPMTKKKMCQHETKSKRNKNLDEKPMSPPSKQPKKRNKRNFSEESYDSTGSETNKRLKRTCGECKNCKAEDCGKCSHCKDKPKFGGPNKLKQKCKLRKCVNYSTPNKPHKSEWAQQLLDRARTPKNSVSSNKKSPAKNNRKQSKEDGKKRGHIPSESETESEAKTPSRNKRRQNGKQKTPVTEKNSEAEDLESGRKRSSRRSAQAANKAISNVVEDDDLLSEASSLEATPKRTWKRKANTPSKTPQRRKGTKLAPIFKRECTKKEETDSDVEIILTEEEKEKQKIRRAFLMSGVPEAVRKQQQTNVCIQLSEYPPFPEITHIQQVEEDDPIWAMLGPDLVFKDPCEEVGPPVFSEAYSLCDKTEAKYDFSTLKQFKEHSTIKEDIVKLLLAEINTSNPSFPVKRTYRQLMNRKKDAEKFEDIKGTSFDVVIDSTKEISDVSKDHSKNTKKRKLVREDLPARQRRKRRKDSECAIVVESDDEESSELCDPSGKKGSLRRSSRSKSKLEVTTEVEESPQKQPPEPIPENHPTCCKREHLWTDKYSPTTSREIVGNSRNIDKLKTWLQDWKKITDLEMKRLQKEMEKQEKRKKQIQTKNGKNEYRASEWSDESDFEMESDSESDYVPDSDWEIGLCNTVLICGPHGIGKTSSVHALAQELGYKVFEVNASSKRGGKQVLAQLQEATQSHQVSNKNLEDVFSTILSGASIKAKEEPKQAKKTEKKALPTAFTNLLNKGNKSRAKEGVPVNQPSSSPTKKRGRKAQNIDVNSTPEKKKPGRRCRRKSSDDVLFVKEERTPEKRNCLDKSKNTKLKDSKIKGPWGNLLNQKQDINMERQDSENSTTKKGLDLSSCSLILFEEVDLVFEEDKGFWAAIQTFMNTTKRPIVLTTRDPNFLKKFDAKCELRVECINMRTPPIANVTTYLQLICLVENVRTCYQDLLSVVEILGGNIRQSILCVQLWIESGGSIFPVKEPISYNKSLLNKKGAATEDEVSQDSQSGSVVQIQKPQQHFLFDENSQLPTPAKKSAVDSEDEFEVNCTKRRNGRSRRLIIEDDSSMDSVMGTPKKILAPGIISDLSLITEEDSQQSNQAFSVNSALAASECKLNKDVELTSCSWCDEHPLMHKDCFESLASLNNNRQMLEGDGKEIPNLLKEISSCSRGIERSIELFLNDNVDIIQLNLLDLLPLPRKVTSLHSYTKFLHVQEQNKRHKRIKNMDDLFDSEGDSDKEFETLKHPDDPLGFSNNDKENTTNGDSFVSKQKPTSTDQRRRNVANYALRPVASAVDAFAKFYDETSFSDSYLRLTPCLSDSNSSKCSSLVKQKFKLNYGASSVGCGQLDCPVVRLGDDDNNWLKIEYTNEIQSQVNLGNFKTCKHQLESILENVSTLCDDEQKEAEDLLTLPIESTKTCFRCTELSAVQTSLQSAYRNASKNVYLELNPKSKRETRGESSSVVTCSLNPTTVALEYMPTLRTICKAEKFKEESKTKRRFLHYLESQHISLKKSTIDTLCTTFT